VYDKSLDGDFLTGDGFDALASRRNSEKGYWNQFIPILDYTNIDTYTDTIRGYIQKGALFSAGELYLPVRLKPHGSNSLDALQNGGIDHIELRMFDINPLAPLGIFRSDLEFTHYFLIYLLSLADFEFTPDMQRAAVENHRAAAGYDLSEIKINSRSAADTALEILCDMEKYFSGIERVTENIRIQKAKITENTRYCVEIYNKYHNGFHDKMLKTAKEGYTDV
jgi:glutamate--cysteine ligase